jgi:hypothetical protein
MTRGPNGYYHSTDIASMMAAVPKMMLSRPQRALVFLKTAVRDGIELESILAQYPNVRYEPLDFHYVCLQNLGAVNENLISDLTCYHGWPGVIWAGFLASLSPSEQYARHLLAARPAAPHNQWILDVALGIIEDRDHRGFHEHTDLLKALRGQLNKLPLPYTELRRVQSEDVLLSIQARVREAYRHGGSSEAARIVLNARASTK